MRRLAVCMAGVVLLAALCGGCLMGRPRWPQGGGAASDAVRAAALTEEARKVCAAAASRAGIDEAIRAYRAVVEVDPSNRAALIGLSHLHLLMGDAYAEGRRAKAVCFRQSMRHAEAAMFTNPRFAERVRSGEPAWRAAREFGEADMEAMAFWVNAVFYLYKDGQLAMGQALNYRWVVRARSVMERMSAVAPDWGVGMVDFIWGVYYLSVPEAVGGDREKSAAFFEAAVAKAGGRLLPLWGRAKYYHVKMGNAEGFREDLEWVLAEGQRENQGHHQEHGAWRAFFVRDARRMLDEMERLF